MFIKNYSITTHTKRRMQHRIVTCEDIRLALVHGQVEYRHGTKFYFLGKRDIPAALRRTHGRLAGLTLVVENGEIVTVYRNPQAHADIKRRDKHRFR